MEAGPDPRADKTKYLDMPPIGPEVLSVSQSVPEKSFPKSASPTLRYILPSFGCRSPLRRPHSDKISHKLGLTAHEKPFSDTLQSLHNIPHNKMPERLIYTRRSGIFIALHINNRSGGPVLILHLFFMISQIHIPERYCSHRNFLPEHPCRSPASLQPSAEHSSYPGM